MSGSLTRTEPSACRSTLPPWRRKPAFQEPVAESLADRCGDHLALHPHGRRIPTTPPDASRCGTSPGGLRRLGKAVSRPSRGGLPAGLRVSSALLGTADGLPV